MILKGSQRAGSRQLADHLLNDRDNDHVTVQELRGFVAGDLRGAMAETHAVAKGTNCRQCVFALSLSPPKNAEVGIDHFMAAVESAEVALGLKDQPRAIIIHEKEGRRHAHVVWSRIDADQMKAINLPFFRRRLNELSKELYLEHGWALPEGYRENWKNPLNFSLEEWQRAKRIGLDPREVKQVFREAWERSDNLASFSNALEDRGFYLAIGNSRSFVALDIRGEIYSVARLAGVYVKDLHSKFGSGEGLSSVEGVQENISGKLADQLRAKSKEDLDRKNNELKPLVDDLRCTVDHQRDERLRLHAAHEERRKRECQDRAARFKRGLNAVLDLLTGKIFHTRRQNEREAFEAYRRDAAQREWLFREHMKERGSLQERVEAKRTAQRRERMALMRTMARALRLVKSFSRSNERDMRREKQRDGGRSLHP